MATQLQSKPKYYFVVETMESVDGKKIRALTPDDDGYFTVPLAVLGGKTRAGVIYDPASIMAQVTNPNSSFGIIARDGTLFGEWGHPSDQSLERVARIDEKCTSHHFKKIYVDGKSSDGGDVIMGRIKPFGPYGQILRDSLMDPDINTAFSIRTICQQRVSPSGELIRDVKLLVTFDAVLAPGYTNATKRYAPGNESMDRSFEVRPDDFYTAEGRAAMESIGEDRIIELFGGEVVRVKQQVLGIHTPGRKSMLTQEGQRRSVFHAMYGNR